MIRAIIRGACNLQALQTPSNYGALADISTYTRRLLGKQVAALQEVFQQLQASL